MSEDAASFLDGMSGPKKRSSSKKTIGGASPDSLFSQTKKKPRRNESVQCYLNPEIYDVLVDIHRLHNLSMSKIVERVVGNYVVTNYPDKISDAVKEQFS